MRPEIFESQHDGRWTHPFFRSGLPCIFLVTYPLISTMLGIMLDDEFFRPFIPKDSDLNHKYFWWAFGDGGL